MVDLKRVSDIIADSGLKKEKVASTLGIAPSTLFNKLTGKTDFTVEEATKFCELFGISEQAERARIFFTQEVDG